MLRFCILSVLLGASLSVWAQTWTPYYNTSVSSKCNGYYEYLPQGYDPNGSTTYPFILFLTGIGEFGNGGMPQLDTVQKNGLPNLIRKGAFPTSFTVNGQTFKFIVITPQFIRNSKPEANDVDAVLNYFINRYKIDTSRIYLTGLSYGGGLCWAYTGHDTAFGHRIAAIAPTASSLPLPLASGYDTIAARSRVIAAGNVPVWATHNRYDKSPDSSLVTITYVNDINAQPGVNPLAQMTIFEANGHNSWDRTYDPNRTDYGGLNVYQWLLKNKRNITPNQPPTANAGADQTITLPTNSVSLSGTGTDMDGSITAYNWTQVSGPATATIASPNAAATNITGLVQGTYVFRLAVTDNSGATGTDDVNVVVNAAPNVPPTANAGPDQTITLPTNSVTLSGSGTDKDGTIASFAWTQVSGLAGATITTANAATTTVTGLQQGSYVFRLTVTDNGGATGTDDVTIMVNAAPNHPPTANAGADQTITLPTNSVTLNGSGTDSDGSITAYSWTKVSGPAAGTLQSPNAATTTVSDLEQGTYVFRLTVTDNNGATSTDDVTVTVNAAPNVPPQANAGADQNITLPTNSVTLSGSGTDADGTIASFAWSKISGPPGGAITTSNNATTTVTGLQQGSYVFRLTVTDNDGATATDDVTINVNAAPNVPPTADAGADQTITLPTNSVQLSGSGNDSDGNIVSYAWTKVSGPTGGTIETPNAAATTVSGLVQGSYVFRLTVTDNNGATGSDDVAITVNTAANQPPTANAGPDQTITLPTNSVTLSGSGTDNDGTISSYSWTKISGPAAGTISNPTAAATTVTGLVEGTYTFQLTVTDNNGATATDDVVITVNHAPNPPPTVNAGADQTITLPTNSVTLSGTASDPDGTIAQYSWTKVSGPTSGTISTPDQATTTVSDLVAGAYTFRLTVTDNEGATAYADVVITVNTAANKTPVANAGADVTITLPTNQVNLSGSGTDADGTVASYLWIQVSGPSGAVITTKDAAATSVTGLVQGAYVFRLTVTDNDGATASDDVTVVVNAAPNQAPVANAGNDITVTLPTNTATLSGSGSDADGSIASFAWTKVSGPAGGTIGTPNAATTTITDLQEGRYVFRLTVTDNNGDTASDDVQIEVNGATNVGLDTTTVASQLIVAPNPTNNYFSLKLLGPSEKPAYLQVIDAAGRLIEQRNNVPCNTVFTLGQQYSPGAYYLQVVQAKRVFVVQLLKLPQ